MAEEREVDVVTNDTTAAEEETVKVNTNNKNVDKKLLNSAKIIERMLNLNTFEDVARDFRFYDDPSDEYKAPEGSLLPLWNFCYETKQKMEVTSLMWSSGYSDLFGVSLGI